MNKLALNIWMSAGIIIGSMHTVSAQEAKETSVSYLKTSVPGFEAEYEISESALEEMAAGYFSDKLKSKQLKSKEYKLYRGTLWAEIAPVKMDVYYKVDGSKKKARITIMASKGYNNFVSSQSDAAIANNIKGFLNGFDSYIEEAQRKGRIEEQSKILLKKEEEYKKYKDEEKDLQRKMEDLQQQLEKNRKNATDKRKEIETEKNRLEDLSR